MSITYRLRTLDNLDAGTFATTLSDWRPGVPTASCRLTTRLIFGGLTPLTEQDWSEKGD